MKTSLVLLGALLSLPVWAADPAFDIKPGLWEFTNTMQMSGLPPIPNLDQMPAEQRARIEAAMKSMAGTPHTTTTKSCITKEGIEKALAQSNSSKDNSCHPKVVSMSSSTVKMHIDCAQEKSKSTGDISLERRDSEHFTGTGAMKTTDPEGRSMDMKWSMRGAFLSSDCGKVKPAGQ